MAAHARLKNEFTEDEKCHSLIRWLKWTRPICSDRVVTLMNVTITDQQSISPLVSCVPYMSLVTRQPVFGVCNRDRLKPTRAATEAR